MATRQGDWRDLLGVYSRAFGAKKIWLGLVGVFATVLIVMVTASVYGWAADNGAVKSCEFRHLGQFHHRDNILLALMRGKTVAEVNRDRARARMVGGPHVPPGLLRMLHTRMSAGGGAGRPGGRRAGAGLGAFVEIAPVLNPFADNMVHFLISVFFYLALIRTWTYCGGAISRLTALEYARDDLPGLREATEMVCKKRRAYFFTPVIPFTAVLFCIVANSVIGLVGSIPGAGAWLMIPGYLLAALVSILLAFFVVFGFLSFGLMMPVVSISGGDAFESWSASYSYALWGFGRLVLYRLLVWVIGLVAVMLAVVVAQVFLSALVGSVGIGVIGRNYDMVWFGKGIIGGVDPLVLAKPGASNGVIGATAVLSVIAFGTRALVLAYAASYYFAANTVIAFLLRKHVDRIEVDEVYVEQEEPVAEAPLDEADETTSQEATPTEDRGEAEGDQAEEEGSSAEGEEQQ